MESEDRNLSDFSLSAFYNEESEKEFANISVKSRPKSKKNFGTKPGPGTMDT